ncbi:hypothetical protein ACISK3_14515 [Morganella morganii]
MILLLIPARYGALPTTTTTTTRTTTTASDSAVVSSTFCGRVNGFTGYLSTVNRV